MMTERRIGTLEEWQAERDALLKEEKQLTRRADELAKKRRELPWVPVEQDYRFETEEGGFLPQLCSDRPQPGHMVATDATIEVSDGTIRDSGSKRK